VDQIENLSLCSGLTSLTLEGNPVTGMDPESVPTAEQMTEYQNFRLKVWSIIPHLQILDDEELSPSIADESGESPTQASTWKQIKRPSTSMDRPITFVNKSEDGFKSELNQGKFKLFFVNLFNFVKGTGEVKSESPAKVLISRRKTRSESVSYALEYKQPLPLPKQVLKVLSRPPSATAIEKTKPIDHRTKPNFITAFNPSSVSPKPLSLQTPVHLQEVKPRPPPPTTMLTSIRGRKHMVKLTSPEDLKNVSSGGVLDPLMPRKPASPLKNVQPAIPVGRAFRRRPMVVGLLAPLEGIDRSVTTTTV
jgi:hypothetical protein